jgi:hypothetical protein
VQVPEHPPTSEKLPEAWPTSPTTGATGHHCRAPVRSSTASPSNSDALLLAFSCRAGAWDSNDTMGEHLPVIWPMGARGRSCHGGVLCTHCRLSSEPCAHPRRRAGAAPGPALLTCGPREKATGPRQAGCAPHDPGREGRCQPGPRADFSLVARELKKILFYFFIRFQTEFKLQKFVSKYLELQKL